MSALDFKVIDIKAEPIAPVLLRMIEDAILFGRIKDLDDVLALALTDPGFPGELRYGLEALRHFRVTYGKGGAQEPKEYLAKQRSIVVENAWASELLNKVKSLKSVMPKEKRA